MSYRDEYEKWLHSSALSEAEKTELESIAGDEKEIESRFFAPPGVRHRRPAGHHVRGASPTLR